MADLHTLQQALGISLDDPSLLEQALIHSSYANENPGLAPASNERLEFLGDAVLGLVVAEKLYRDLSHFSEGEMTKLRASLVCRDSLSRMAKSIGLGDHLYLGKGEEASGGRHKPANLACAMESVLAAVYLSQGLAAADDCITRLLEPELNRIVNQGVIIDYKSRLQEFVQSRQQLTPAYQVIKAEGPDHLKEFTVEVTVDNNVLGRGSGRSKKTAENEAARAALKLLSADFTR